MVFLSSLYLDASVSYGVESTKCGYYTGDLEQFDLRASLHERQMVFLSKATNVAL